MWTCPGFTEFDILEKYRKSFNESELGRFHSVRPIVRGKEKKSVEFGANVNNIQIDGISFIEHISFKAFKEGDICGRRLLIFQ